MNDPTTTGPAAQLCAAGRRLDERGFVAANEGNLSLRLPDDRVLCSPTLIGKGAMTPADLCTVDLDGRQLAGQRRATSEVLMHLEIYRRNPATRAVVHTHPPHATAFGLTHQELPTGILPEVELFLGRVPAIPYETPGTAAFAARLAPHAGSACCALLCNHGAVAWDQTLEHAVWWLEALESYCRVLAAARLYGPIQRLPAAKVRELLALRPKFGRPADPRSESAADADLFLNPEFGRTAADGG